MRTYYRVHQEEFNKFKPHIAQNTQQKPNKTKDVV